MTPMRGIGNSSRALREICAKSNKRRERAALMRGACASVRAEAHPAVVSCARTARAARIPGMPLTHPPGAVPEPQR